MTKQPEWKSLPEPKVNSRWDTSKSGSIVGATRTCRIMGVVEGYVIARYAGCMPFITHLSNWHKLFTPKPMPNKQRRESRED
jgi:hypothetical protein